MMAETIYISVEEALQMHQVLIERFGGSEGVRDLGMLQSALLRPKSGYYSTLSEQAAALLDSLANNHPFVDGNKCMAVAVTATFLDVNGWELHVGGAALERFIVEKVIKKRPSVSEIAAWLERRMVQRGGGVKSS